MSVQLPTLRWGDGERRVLLVHGLMSSARVWWRVAGEMADRGWEVTAVDLRGHGLAPPAPRFSISDLAGDLLGLEGRWDLVVGHSLGGAAVTLAARGPGWCDRVLLVDPLLAVPEDRRTRLELEFLSEREASPEQIAAENPLWHEDDVFWKVWSAQQCSPSVIRRVMSENHPWDVTASLRDIPVPCTVLAADPDRGGFGDWPLLRTLSLENPRVHVVQLPGVGHSLFREQPDLVIQATDH